MTAAALDHPEPWTEAEYLALPETNQRIELLDGTLLVTPAPVSDHQQWARRLANLLEAAAPSDIEVLEAVNLRVGPSRLLIPDVLVTSRLGTTKVYQPEDALIVVEVLSPSSVSIDRVLKPYLYAAAGVPWFLRVEPDQGQLPELWLYELGPAGYEERARATAGRPLTLDQPFAAVIDPIALTHRPDG
jgi:Uma2 family endonuclease